MAHVRPPGSLDRKSGPLVDTIQTTLVNVRNDSGEDLVRFNVLSIGDPVFLPADNLDQFQSAVYFIGESPDYATRAGAFVILAESIPSGEIGRAWIAGVCPAMVLATSGQTPEWADVADAADAGDRYLLKERTQGAAQVLWIDSSGDVSGDYEQRWAIVRLGASPVARTLRVFECATTVSELDSGTGWDMSDADPDGACNPGGAGRGDLLSIDAAWSTAEFCGSATMFRGMAIGAGDVIAGPEQGDFIVAMNLGTQGEPLWFAVSGGRTHVRGTIANGGADDDEYAAGTSVTVEVIDTDTGIAGFHGRTWRKPMVLVCPATEGASVSCDWNSAKVRWEIKPDCIDEAGLGCGLMKDPDGKIAIDRAALIGRGLEIGEGECDIAVTDECCGSDGYPGGGSGGGTGGLPPGEDCNRKTCCDGTEDERSVTTCDETTGNAYNKYTATFGDLTECGCAAAGGEHTLTYVSGCIWETDEFTCPDGQFIWRLTVYSVSGTNLELIDVDDVEVVVIRYYKPGRWSTCCENLLELDMDCDTPWDCDGLSEFVCVKPACNDCPVRTTVSDTFESEAAATADYTSSTVLWTTDNSGTAVVAFDETDGCPAPPSLRVSLTAASTVGEVVEGTLLAKFNNALTFNPEDCEEDLKEIESFSIKVKALSTNTGEVDAEAIYVGVAILQGGNLYVRPIGSIAPGSGCETFAIGHVNAADFQLVSNTGFGAGTPDFSAATGTLMKMGFALWIEVNLPAAETSVGVAIVDSFEMTLCAPECTGEETGLVCCSAIDFGTVCQDSLDEYDNATATCTITNNSSATVSLTALLLTGTTAISIDSFAGNTTVTTAPFTVTVDAGDTATVTLSLDDSELTSASDTLRITGAVPGAPCDVAVTGEVIDCSDLLCEYGHAKFLTTAANLTDYDPEIDPAAPGNWRQWGSAGATPAEWVALDTPWSVSASNALPGLIGAPDGLGTVWCSHLWDSAASNNVRIWIHFGNMAPGDVTGITYRVTESGGDVTSFGEIQFVHNGAGSFDVNVNRSTTGPDTTTNITSVLAGAGLSDHYLRLEIVDNSFKAFWGGDLYRDSSSPTLSWTDSDTPQTAEHGIVGYWGSGGVGATRNDWFCVENITTPVDSVSTREG